MATRDIAIKCPVCLGRCKDELGAECKPCSGNGILWGKETDESHIPMLPFWYPALPSPAWPYGITWTADTSVLATNTGRRS